MSENGYPERNAGRRPHDSAHLLKWVPVLSLAGLLILQTIYVTRWGSGIETSNATLIATVAEFKAELKALAATVANSAAPSAQMQLRVDYLERAMNENRQAIAEMTRRLATEEVRSRARDR